MDFSPQAPFTVLPADEEDVCWAAGVAPCVYSGLDVIPVELMLEWFEANPTGFSIIEDCHGRRCGNVDILPLRPDTLARFLRGEFIEREIRAGGLFRPHEADQIDFLYAESFVALAKGGSGNPQAVYSCLKSLLVLVGRICAPSQVKKLYAVGASERGIRLMQHLDFVEIAGGSHRRDGHQVFGVSFPDLVRKLNGRQKY